MSKDEVLEQIYPDEVSNILKKANIERARQRERELTGYFYTLMAPTLPWIKNEDGLQKDLINSVTSELSRIHAYLRSQNQNSLRTETGRTNESNQQSKEDPFDKLKRLQGAIAGTQARKKAQEAR